MAGFPGTSVENRLVFLNEQKLPAVITAAQGESLLEFMDSVPKELEVLQRRYGAILFRGFDLRTAEEFYAVAAHCFGDTWRSYLGGISPRGQIISGVYESTRHPCHLRIPQHNEMPYLPDPPRTLAFFCEVEPDRGGETPLVDSRSIYQYIPQPIRTKFEIQDIRYHRHLHGPRRNPVMRALSRIIELRTSWMAAFNTDQRSEVERICAEHGATVQWNWEESVPIADSLPALREHPRRARSFGSTRRPPSWPHPEAPARCAGFSATLSTRFCTGVHSTQLWATEIRSGSPI